MYEQFTLYVKIFTLISKDLHNYMDGYAKHPTQIHPITNVHASSLGVNKRRLYML